LSGRTEKNYGNLLSKYPALDRGRDLPNEYKRLSHDLEKRNIKKERNYTQEKRERQNSTPIPSAAVREK
jgi:hypothetical protein